MSFAILFSSKCITETKEISMTEILGMGAVSSENEMCDICIGICTCKYDFVFFHLLALLLEFCLSSLELGNPAFPRLSKVHHSLVITLCNHS